MLLQQLLFPRLRIVQIIDLLIEEVDGLWKRELFDFDFVDEVTWKKTLVDNWLR